MIGGLLSDNELHANDIVYTYLWLYHACTSADLATKYMYSPE